MPLPKTWYTTQEIVNMRLPGMPTTRAGMLIRAKKEKWPSRPNRGNARGREYPLILALPQCPVAGMDKESKRELKNRLEQLKTAHKETAALIDRLSTVLKVNKL